MLIKTVHFRHAASELVVMLDPLNSNCSASIAF